MAAAEKHMPFHPESLTKACLKDLAKNLQKGASDAIGHRLKLAQAQELLARALGHATWNDALSRALTNHPLPHLSRPPDLWWPPVNTRRR